jgi:hypothetical protein
MMGHIPLYLNGSLSYISSRSFRPSLTLKPLDPILNTASLLLSLYSLPPPWKALSSRQVLYLLDTSFGHDPLVSEDSRSLLSPRRPLHLYHHSATRFFTYSFAHHPHYFLPLFPSINRRLMNSIDHRIGRLCRHYDRCLHILTTRCPTI